MQSYDDLTEARALRDEAASGLADARQRAVDLDRLVLRIEEQQPEMTCLGERMGRADKECAEIDARLDRLRRVRTPEGVPELAERLAKVLQDHEEAKEARDEAMKERQRRQNDLDELPKEADLSQHLQGYDDLTEARALQDEAASSLAEARTRLDGAESESERAEAAVEAAVQARRSMEDKHRVYHLAKGLAPGDSCPVCRQHVSDLPEVDVPEEMEGAEDALNAAQRDRESAARELTQAKSAEAAQQQSFGHCQSRMRDLESELAAVAPREQVEASLERIRDAAGALQEANEKEESALERANEAQALLDDLAEEAKGAWREYDDRRDSLAVMKPPPPDQGNLAAAWDDLASWAQNRAEEERALHEQARRARETAASALDERREQIAGWCRDAKVDVGDGEEPLTRAAKELTQAKAAEAAQRQSLGHWQSRIRDLESELAAAPPREQVEASLEQIRDAARALQEANENEENALERANESQELLDPLEEKAKGAWREYGRRRDRLAEMEPPAPDGEDLAAAWDDLASWAQNRAEEERALHEQARRARETAASALDERREQIAGWCRDAKVDVGDGEEPLTACGREQGLQAAEIKRIEQILQEMKRKQEELKRLQKEATVAGDLARHLNALNFEGWLMAQVLKQLCKGATQELRKLSNDSYSLDLDGRNNFVVVDHRNADERRPVKTLSGGETFLASLSLALALSEHLSDLAVGGAAKLEALFLDEGFGTLDTETLDSVISAIEELGSRGRLVGVVTHVKELAERIPVRYEVTKEGNRSSIERVVA